MKPRKIEDILKEDLKDYVSELDIKKLWLDIEQEVKTVEEESDTDFKPVVIVGLALFMCAILFSYWRQNENYAEVHQEIVNISSQMEKREIINDNVIERITIISQNKEKSVSNGTAVILPIIYLDERGNFEENSLSNELKERSIEYSIYSEAFFEETWKNKNKNFVVNKSENYSAKRTKAKEGKDNQDISPLIFNEIQPLEIVFSDSILQEIEGLLQANLLAKQNEDYRRKPDFQFSIGAYGGASIALRDLSNKTGESIQYLQAREDTEKILETLQAGLKVAVEHESGLSLQTGMQMMQITENFKFSGSRIQIDTIEDGFYGYLINPNGDTIPVYDQIINTQEALFEKNIFNSYRFLDIPISVGYYLGDGDWSVGMQAGIIANLALKTKGEILNENEGIKDLSDASTSFFRTNVGLSYRVALSGRYLLSDNLQLEATIHGRYFPKTFTTNDYSLNQKYTVLGVNLGMNYLF